MSDINPFEELDNHEEHIPYEEESIERIGRDVNGSYNMTRDIFTAISTLTDKIFTLFSGVMEIFDPNSADDDNNPDQE